MCSLRLTNATRFISATSVRSSFAKVQILKLISVPSITKRFKHGGSESNVLLNSLNRNSFNHGRSQFNSLADAQATDQYPRLGKLATLVESVDFQNAVTKFGMLLELNIPDIKDLLAAFIHKSYLIANHKKLQHEHNDNERLSALGFQTAKQAITEYLLTEFPYLSAEETWDIQNALLDNYVPKVAWDLNIQRFMVFKNQPLFLMMSQTMFALVGTVYIHESPERAADFVRKRLIPELTTETVQHLVKLQHPKLLLKLFAERKGSELPVTKILKERKSQSRFHLSQPHLYKVGIFEGNKLIAKGASTLLDKAEKEACQKALLSVYMEELNSFNLELSACTSVAENMINFGLTTAGQRVVELFKHTRFLSFLLQPQNQLIILDITSYWSQSELAKMDIGCFGKY